MSETTRVSLFTYRRGILLTQQGSTCRRSAESSTPPASPTSDDLPTPHDQTSRTGYPTGCTYTRPITLSGNSSSLRAGHEATGMHATSYVWNVKVSPSSWNQSNLREASCVVRLGPRTTSADPSIVYRLAGECLIHCLVLCYEETGRVERVPPAFRCVPRGRCWGGDGKASTRVCFSDSTHPLFIAIPVTSSFA